MKVKNFLFSSLGIIIVSFGVALVAVVNYGLDPWGVLFNGFALAWNKVSPFGFNILYGDAITIVSVFTVTIASFILKERWNYLSVIAGIVLGQFVNIFAAILSVFDFDGTPVKIIAIFVAMILIGIGISFTIIFPFFMSPVDYFSIAVDKLTPTNYGVTRVICDTSAVALGFIVVYALTQNFTESKIGFGTVIMFLLGGIIVNFCLTNMQKIFTNKTDDR